ncbi:zinc ABC transporter substrate-binding protein [Marinobacter sp.]|uniref:zinc ABC transporter substrate-binding protein n=1 Tax=Marinobacter sp. TaxID=50741 RepID=UPI00384EC390
MKHAHILAGSLLAAFSLSSGVAQLHAAEPPHVVTSLKPLELLVRAVATDTTRVTTLVPSGASPHTYQIRPSERKALETADLIFWVGPDMETFLDRLLSGADFSGRTVAFAPDTKEDEAGDRHDEHGTDHDHGHGEDPHIWLDPALALGMAEQIHAHLSELPDAEVNTLDSNLERFRSNLGKKEKSIRQQLKPLKDISIFTYHDAFGRFAEHYGLSVAGVMTHSPERPPGARHLAEIQAQLAGANKPCLLTEPQFSRKWWRSITENLELTMSTWDPLATDITPDAQGYLRFQQALADAALKCLPEQTQ